eukprot:m.849501 g.849501  ORF g.849501 m.849501 type:complete len:114 (-) comp23490_c2_seq53:721-1062(-)
MLMFPICVEILRTFRIAQHETTSWNIVAVFCFWKNIVWAGLPHFFQFEPIHEVFSPGTSCVASLEPTFTDTQPPPAAFFPVHNHFVPSCASCTACQQVTNCKKSENVRQYIIT